MARHPNRPGFESFIGLIFEGFVEIHGDRRYADDPAMVCGMARFQGDEVLVVGTQKGREKTRPFYFAHPTGLRAGAPPHLFGLIKYFSPVARLL